MPILKPKLLTTLKNYTLKQFRADAMSGVIVGIVALPLAIAFAIASGVSPERGIFTAIVAGLIISALGGSRVQIGGPTGAFIVIVYGIVQKYGTDGLTVATIMGGIFLLIMGLARFGSAVKFIPYPVVVGFTSGIAVIIFSSQIKDFFGLSMGAVPADFTDKWRTYANHFTSVNFYAAGLGLLTILILPLWKKITGKIPGTLIAILVTTALVHFFKLPIETIGSRFGAIPHSLPTPELPKISFGMIRDLIPTAMTIAILAGIESLLSAVIADGMIGGKHRSNMELVAQGIANIIAPLFGGIPATGAIARTTVNIQNGGRTPIAGIIHSITLFMIMIFLGRWAIWIPLPCLAAILIMVAYNMSEWHSFLAILKSPISDVAVLLTTFFLTVFVDLTVAIQFGMILAIGLFMRRMALVTSVDVITKEFIDEDDRDDPNAINRMVVPDGVEVYEITGPFFFGACYKFREAMNQSGARTPRVRIIRMRNVLAIDASGIQVLKEEYKNSKRQHIPFIISGIHAQPMMAISKAGLLETIGEEHILASMEDALAYSRNFLSLTPSPHSGPADATH